ncbi:hypothetical protein P7C70_g1026, partial [Phenoliferia sp. Uapishka_3]
MGLSVSRLCTVCLSLPSSFFSTHLPFQSTDFQNTQGIIFVVDSNDRERVSEAREELQRMLNEDELRDALLLVFANKQDLPNAMNAAEITDKLGLHSLRQRTWYIQATCATSGDGLYEGLEWVSADSFLFPFPCASKWLGGSFAGWCGRRDHGDDSGASNVYRTSAHPFPSPPQLSTNLKRRA